MSDFGERRIEVTVEEADGKVCGSQYLTPVNRYRRQDIDQIWDKFYKVDKATDARVRRQRQSDFRS